MCLSLEPYDGPRGEGAFPYKQGTPVQRCADTLVAEECVEYYTLVPASSTLIHFFIVSIGDPPIPGLILLWVIRVYFWVIGSFVSHISGLFRQLCLNLTFTRPSTSEDLDVTLRRLRRSLVKQEIR